MRRSHFQTTCTEFDIYIIVFDNRNHTVYQRNDHLLTPQVLVLRVVRIDTHGSIAHDRFRTGGCHYGVTILAFDFITEVKQFAMFFLINYFFIGKSGQGLRVPVHHTYTTVDQSFFKQVYEYFQYAFRTFFIHRKSRTVPIAGCTQFT